MAWQKCFFNKWPTLQFPESKADKVARERVCYINKMSLHGVFWHWQVAYTARWLALASHYRHNQVTTKGLQQSVCTKPKICTHCRTWCMCTNLIYIPQLAKMDEDASLNLSFCCSNSLKVCQWKKGKEEVNCLQLCCYVTMTVQLFQCASGFYSGRAIYPPSTIVCSTWWAASFASPAKLYLVVPDLSASLRELFS